jgi:hypothetical protein
MPVNTEKTISKYDICGTAKKCNCPQLPPVTGVNNRLNKNGNVRNAKQSNVHIQTVSRNKFIIIRTFIITAF